MTDPLAPYDAGSDPLALAPPTPPAPPAAPTPTPTPSVVPVPEPKLSKPKLSNPLIARPGTWRPEGQSRLASWARSLDPEADVLALPPPQRKRSLLWRMVTFSRELTVIVVLVLIIGIASGAAVVVEWVQSIGSTFTADEMYDKERYSATIKDGGKIKLETYLDYVGSWDHEDCSGLSKDKTVQKTITDAGCESGIEAVYDRADLDYTLYQRILEFPDKAAAKKGGKDFGDTNDVSFEFMKDLTFSVDTPKADRLGIRADVEGAFLIYTVAILETEDKKSAEEADEGMQALHIEHLNVLGWTDL